MKINKFQVSSFKYQVFAFLFLVTCYLLPVTTTNAQSLTHTSRLSLPVSGSATVVIENKEGVEKKSIIVSDYLSSTKVIIDETGKVIDNPEYYPYGNTVESNKYQVTGDKSNQTDNTNQNLDILDLLPDTNTTDRLYTGQRKVTDESPVYNYNARYYNPDIGLFIQPDTVEGINRFAYVGGNPVMRNDPTGHEGCTAGVRDVLFDPICNWFDSGGQTSDNLYGLLPAIAIGDTLLGSIPSMASEIGDKVAGDIGGSDQMDEAYASLGGGTAMAVAAMGIVQPDPGDLARGARVARLATTSEVFEVATVDKSVARLIQQAYDKLLPIRPESIAADIVEGVDSYTLREGMKAHNIADLIDPKLNNRVVSFTEAGGRLSNDHYLYVLKSDGTLILGARERTGVRAPHSALASGEEVVAAGNIHFSRGSVQKLDVMSGHYHPESWRMGAVWAKLDELGIPYANGKRRSNSTGARSEVFEIKYGLGSNPLY